MDAEAKNISNVTKKSENQNDLSPEDKIILQSLSQF